MFKLKNEIYSTSQYLENVDEKDDYNMIWNPKLSNSFYK